MPIWLLRLFNPYREEGATTPEEAFVDQSEVEEELGEYDHPYPVPWDRKGVIEIYGDCGQSKLSSRWERRNMVTAKGLPGSWNRGRGRMYCHRKMAPALREALRRCEAYGVLGYIERMGCFKWRHIQHNPRKPLSFHSWGIAVDINPKDNRLRRYERGTAPRPHGPLWKKAWPEGVPEKLVQAFKEAGFAWGGDWETTPDPMHFELVR